MRVNSVKVFTDEISDGNMPALDRMKNMTSQNTPRGIKKTVTSVSHVWLDQASDKCLLSHGIIYNIYQA